MANILVVDDELGIRDLLWEILNDEGHTVELAENAAHRAEEITRLVEAAGWRVLRTQYCMLILSRLVLAQLQVVPFPLPLNPLLALENLVPDRWRSRFLPYDIVVVAETA